MIMRLATAAIAAAVFLAPAAHADLITNGSFEAGTGAPPIGGDEASEEGDTQAVGTTKITDWTIVANDGTTINPTDHNVLWIGNSGYGLTTPYGNDFLDLTGTSDSSPYDGVQQTITTVAGQAYVLTFDLGVATNGGNFGGTISVDAEIGSSATPFTDDGTTGTLAGVTRWTDESLEFTASSTSTVISLIGETDSAGQFIGLDNVAVNSAPPVGVPEPASLALLTTALIGYGAIRRRRKTA